MKIVFFGSPGCALPSLKKILAAGQSVACVVTQPDKPKGRGRKPAQSPVKRFALDQDIPILQPAKIKKDYLALQKIKSIEPDIIVVVAYGQIIPASIIYLPRYGSINLHFSLLPEYRGASPVQWVLLNGEKKTGITVFRLDEKMDEGDILSQEEIEILPGEKSSELESRLARYGAELLVKTLSQIDKIRPVKQDHSRATYAPRLKKEDGRIDWTKNATYIDQQVRAFDPWPSSYTFLNGKRIKIHEGKVSEKTFRYSPPGVVTSVAKEGIEVCCGEETAYLIQRLQPENKKEMDAHAFSLGAKLKPGDSFT